MTNDLRERLEALSAGASAGKWKCTSFQSGTVSILMRDWHDGGLTQNLNPTYGYMGASMSAYNIGRFRDEAEISAEKQANGHLITDLVNAFRSGDLVTRQEMDEAVAKAVAEEREACAVVCNDRGVAEQSGYGLNRGSQNFFRARDLIRARSISEPKPNLMIRPLEIMEGE